MQMCACVCVIADQSERQPFKRRKNRTYVRAVKKGKGPGDSESRENLSCCCCARGSDSIVKHNVVWSVDSYGKREGSGLALCGVGTDIRHSFL